MSSPQHQADSTVTETSGGSRQEPKEEAPAGARTSAAPTAEATDVTGDELFCKKTGKVMAWDQAACPCTGKPCAYRGECQIQIVLAELKNDTD
jgi:hypothetical protein